ncbi:DUF4302 domain-containing protein [Flavobacterium sp. KACC 22761]|uniref:DUF4302 domain-containing protein n=1 Tax=Flavobacterium sp. KACC 22761 TaxID=3092665 RepID=UPI002A75E62B|nr:DUF4302 domain-containing protein [Flavobacterium sp. KACC 22761]WPO77978.1 DUF4302 domain-containing protein [Flavobacterium sp. KACC 22761]
MKAKNILKYLVLILISLQFFGCSSTDAEQKFDQTPTERLNAQKKELADLLLTSEYGWKAVYFTDNTLLGGYTHLFKFAADGTVQMASDFDSDTNTYKSEYAVQLGSTVSLTFTTKNRIHLLSDSESYPIDVLRGKGYLGDFQFLYYGQENGEIIFKTNRTVQELRFVKANAADWANLPKHTIMEQNVIGSDARPLFRLLETNDGTTKHQFDFNFAVETRFAEANSLESGFAMTYDMGIAYTPDGIIVSPAVQVGSQKLSVFKYNDTDGSFTATGTGGVSATIKYSTKPLIITEDYKALLDGKPQMVIGYIAANLYTAPTTSKYCKALLDKANATLPVNQKISRIQIYFNSPFGNYIEYRFGGGKPTVYHNFTTTEDATNKTLILNHDSWDNGSAYIPAPAFLKELDDEFMNPKGLYIKKESFKITYSNTIWTLTSATSNFRITTYQLN